MSNPHDHEKFASADQELQERLKAGLGSGPGEPLKTSQPPGLWVLFITEMWERFSYYGMRALLVLYLATTTAPLLPSGEENKFPGFGWSDADAYTLYGIYTFMVYVTSIFGGMLADRFFGTHRSMLLGGSIIAVGHITLALSELFKIEPGVMATPETSFGSVLMFLSGLALIIIGTGFFKPCVSVMVGQMYGANDPRRDSGFTIFYMGINLGAFFSPIVAGWLAERYGWHWGFGAAAVGMIIGLAFYSLFRGRFLKGIGDAPKVTWGGGDIVKFLTLLGVLVGIPALPLLLYFTGGLGAIADVWATLTEGNVKQTLAWLIGVGAIFGGILAFLFNQPGAERGKLAVVFILAFLGNIAFWTAFEQAGSSLNIFAERNTDCSVFGFEFPSAWFQSVNPLGILLFAPVFSWMWLKLEKARKDPSTPVKFAVGLYLLGLSFIAMVFGALEARGGNLAGPQWLLITYVVYTWGELALSPVGLSMVTKLSPARLQSLMMGLWFFSIALSNLSAGLVARVSTKFTGDNPEMNFIIPGLPGFFLMLVVSSLVMGTVLLVLSPFIKNLMGDVH